MGTLMLATAFALAGLMSGVDPALVSALCFVESGHNVNALAPRDGGSPSLGVCQLKLRTARALGYVGRAKGLMEPSTNALYASLYLAKQKQRFGSWARAISAYNAGRPVKGNRRYVRRVMARWHHGL